jgi:hypothetical protein
VTAASCTSCGAALASDQEYCLACGARRAPDRRPPRRGPLAAALAAVAIALGGLGLAYRHERDEADREASSPSPRSRVIPVAPSSAPEAGQGGVTPAPLALPGASPSR